ncbi:PBP1A family penicillin-binding protein [Halobacillus locisalis]|uniref:PBP1A family penicillin-binding protein n=1 Tax=Halobacillus locisalis TaxID=220753 RepID=A0A838CPI3_9BACI|nr:penicillin-binding protein 1A [Halobacillus locisalis]MBA2173910.1 PBP1A family penicillin-binding protein [Halobacillus locisalis]
MANESQSRTARKKQMKASKKGKNKPRIKKIFMTLFILGILLVLGGGGLFAYYVSSAPELDESQLSDPYSSKVYDMNDNLVADLSGSEKRTKVTYDEIPQLVKDAVIATEDARFYDHIGIDFRRIVAAVWANITEGFGAEGASTITQQVIKRSFLSEEKTLERKVQEQYLAIKLDQDYSKEQILEMYLNKIYYGARAYGVAEAADTYFGKKNLEELTLPEAALLAGLPQRPSGYNPFENPDLAQDRMQTVLSLMVQHGKITQQEADEAKQTNVEDLLVTQDSRERTPYDAFIDRVQEEVREKMDGAEIFKDGLKIYTTLDPDAQQSVQRMLSNEGPIAWPDESIQSGVAVTDTKTGAIRAIGGGRDYQTSQFNFATEIERQAGSTFKPIMSYGPAIEYDKMSTYHQILDEPYEINGKEINNFDNQYRGWVSARYALSRSLNIPAMKTMQEVGMDRAKGFAEGLGIDFTEGRVLPIDAIGGGDTNVTPVQMAGAYAAFGNEGVYNEPYAVRKIEVPGQETIDTIPESKSAMSSYTAFMISNMLQTTMSEGSGRRANVQGLPEAGKTGTTNRVLENGDDIAPDSWFNGYTTNYSISIWTGYTDINTGLSQAGKDIPKQIFQPLMDELSQGIDTPDFTKPDSAVWVDVEEGSRPAKLPSSYTPGSQIVTELFHVDNQPSKVSKQYQKLDPVQQLSGTFNLDTQSINLSWAYGDSENVSYRVDVSVNGGQPTELTTTEQTSLNIENVELGANYQFAVSAISTDGNAQSSDPVTVQVQTGEIEEENPDQGDEQDNEENEDQNNEDENQNNDESDEQDDSGSGNNGNNGSNNNENDDTDDSGNNNNGSDDGGSGNDDDSQNTGDDTNTDDQAA